MINYDTINKYRVFPRITLVFMGGVFTFITYYYFSVPLESHTEWTLASYGVISAPFVAFFNKYMSTGNSNE